MSKKNQGIIPFSIGLTEEKLLTIEEIQKKMRTKCFGDKESTPPRPAHPFVLWAIETSTELCEAYSGVTVTGDSGLEMCREMIDELKELKKKIHEGFESDRDKLHQVKTELLKIRNDLTEKVDEMVLVLGSRCAQYETEKLRKRQIENQRLIEAAKKEREKLLKKAEDSKKPETKEKYEEIAELIVAPTEEIDLKNMEKKIQVKDQEEFLKWAIGIPEIIENISVSKTGLKKIIDKNFSIDRSHYVESMNAYYQKVPGAVIIARKK